MLYSAGCEHAMRAMTYLALFGDRNRYSQVRDIAPDSNIPRAYLAKILQTLARNGLLESSKGRGGGFRLGRDPRTVKLAEIVEVIDGLDRFSRCIIGDNICSDEQPCPHHEHWKMIRFQILQFLQSHTLADSAEGLRRKLQLQNGNVIGNGHAKVDAEPVAATH